MLSVSLNNSTGAGLAGQNILSQMSAQFSVKREAPGILYTEYRVCMGGLPLYLNYSRNFIGQAYCLR